jgi:two-component system, chemotaxis family, sensor kinase CheA
VADHDALMKELLQMFSVEAAEHIQTLNQTLLKLEREPESAQEYLNAAFRAAHSLKGSARAVELLDIEKVAHEAEAILSSARNGKLTFNGEVVDALLAATDLIQTMVGGEKAAPEQISAMQSRLKALAEAPTQSIAPLPATVTIEPAPGSGTLDALMKELLQMFAVEAVEHLETLSQSLLKLEKEQKPEKKTELLNAAFRSAHSLKGSARAVELPDIESIAHEAEAVLSAARADKLVFTSEIVDVLLAATDSMQTLVAGEQPDTAQVTTIKQKLKDAAEGKLSPPPAPPPPSPEPMPAAPPAVSGAQTAPNIFKELQTGIEKQEGKKRDPIKPSPLSTGATEETIRVSVEKLDDLMAQAGELIVSKISADERLNELRDLRSLMGRWEKAWGSTVDLQRRIDLLAREDQGADWREVLDFLGTSQRYFSESVAKIRALDKAMSSDNMRMTLVTQAIQEEIRRVRMLPVETLVPTMERVVRDVARAINKKAQLIVTGASVELDKRVLEDLKDPLVHLLRNSIDHGVEEPEARTRAGKPEIGTVIMSVTQRGGNVHIIVADDGKGLDATAIRRSSVKKGLILQHEADNMPDEEAYLLIFHAGLSTKEEVTEVSGRGVGMDVVKAQLENLQGRINVKSTPGQGTEFHLIVPISLATIRGLIVRLGLDSYSLPLHAVEKIITIRPDTIYQVEGNRMFDYFGEPMPVIHLADVLERPRDPDREDRLLAIILAGAERHMAFLVDDFISEQEMVVKPLGKQLKRVRNVAGATLLGTGQPIVILNAADLLKSAQVGRIGRRSLIIDRKPESELTKAPARILIVDDSITTRTLERNILQGAGYNVTTAVDGVEALALLETEKFDLVVSDIEMPRIDGFELVEWIRQSSAYGDIPIVLVTSLESQEHRERGLKVGADAYIIKSGFEQSVLLDTISQFL